MQAYQAIVTKYIPATATKGPRVQAKCDYKTKYYPWRSNVQYWENHASAAKKLAHELEWLENNDKMVVGSLPGNKGYVFVIFREYSLVYPEK